ncbi:hypothetical protein [Streptomyces sp. NPDC046821]|uniref:hypothetical protein n=1 Tax=Streptomyces sp. NPDC046821 TaxID=3154702 RepID=UPI00340C5018
MSLITGLARLEAVQSGRVQPLTTAHGRAGDAHALRRAAESRAEALDSQKAVASACR